MKIKVHGKDVKVSQDLTDRIAYKLSFLDKYILIDEETTAQVMLKKHGRDIKLETTIPTKIGYLRSEVVDNDVQDAIDKSIDKLEDQLRRQKTRLSRRHKDKLAKTFINDEEVQAKEVEKPVKIKRIPLDEMDFEEAVIHMELMDHDFFVYRDVDSKVVCVLYKRESGGYGILEAV